jgi:acetolactate decarboxylase
LGSQHGLAGELVLLNGKAYKISVDGKAVSMPDTATLPFAATKFFKAENKWTISRPLNLQQLQSYFDSVINTNLFSAIKITGRFTSIKYKCYYPRQRPYPAIKDMPAKFFDSTNIRGTIVGFFTPKSAAVLNSPDYHFHFINSAYTSGGHVEDCIVENITVEIDYADGLLVKLPQKGSLKDINLNEEMKQ